jgi:hypothetical protein
MSPLRRRGFDTREGRRKILFYEFGFLCHCEVCEVGNPTKDISDGKKEDVKGGAIEKGSTNKSISYPWKQSVPLNSPSSIKTFFHSPRHFNSLLSGAPKSQMINSKERDEQSVVVPKGVVVTRIEL